MEKHNSLQVYVSKIDSQDQDAVTIEGTLASKAESTKPFAPHSIEDVGKLLRDFSNQMLDNLRIDQKHLSEYSLDEIQIRASIKFDGKLSIYIVSGGSNVGGEINFVFKKKKPYTDSNSSTKV